MVVRYQWEPDGMTYKCGVPGCDGTIESLRVSPPRGKAYLNHILMCNKCERIVF